MLDVTSENVRHELEEMVKGTSVALEFDCQVAALDVVCCLLFVVCCLLFVVLEELVEGKTRSARRNFAKPSGPFH